MEISFKRVNPVDLCKNVQEDRLICNFSNQDVQFSSVLFTDYSFYRAVTVGSNSGYP